MNQSVNSAKGVSLPSLSNIQVIAELQFEFLQDACMNQPDRQKARIFDEFIQELKLTEDQLLTSHIFKKVIKAPWGL